MAHITESFVFIALFCFFFLARLSSAGFKLPDLNCKPNARAGIKLPDLNPEANAKAEFELPKYPTCPDLNVNINAQQLAWDEVCEFYKALENPFKKSECKPFDKFSYELAMMDDKGKLMYKIEKIALFGREQNGPGCVTAARFVTSLRHGEIEIELEGTHGKLWVHKAFFKFVDTGIKFQLRKVRIIHAAQTPVNQGKNLFDILRCIPDRDHSACLEITLKPWRK